MKHQGMLKVSALLFAFAVSMRFRDQAARAGLASLLLGLLPLLTARAQTPATTPQGQTPTQPPIRPDGISAAIDVARASSESWFETSRIVR